MKSQYLLLALLATSSLAATPTLHHKVKGPNCRTQFHAQMQAKESLYRCIFVWEQYSQNKSVIVPTDSCTSELIAYQTAATNLNTCRNTVPTPTPVPPTPTPTPTPIPVPPTPTPTN